jgi:hypothetical protein
VFIMAIIVVVLGITHRSAFAARERREIRSWS